MNAKDLLDEWVKGYSTQAICWEDFTDMVSHTVNDLSKEDFEDFAEFCAKKLQEKDHEKK